MIFKYVIPAVFLCLSATAQTTFERAYNFSQVNAIAQLPDHSFIGTSDSSAIGVVFHIDSLGNQIGSFVPTVRGETMRIWDMTIDRFGGGLALSGYSADSTSSDTTITYLLLNSQMQNADSLFLPGLGVFAGGGATTILQTKTSDFILGITDYMGAGSASSRAEKVLYPATHDWTATTGSYQSRNPMALDSSDNLLMSTYNATSGSSSHLALIDTDGVILHTFGVTDTIMGGSLVFTTVTSPAPNGNYMYGASFQPFSQSYQLIYLAQLDTAFNIAWEKYLDWGFYIEIVAITPTADSGIVVLMNTINGIALYKTNANGDSLWTQFHNQMPGASAFRFKTCSDGGFIVAGEYNSGTLFGYLMKTDSLGRVFPNAEITAIGDPTFCEGSQVVLSALPGYFYLWSTGETTQSISVDTTGYYWVTVTDSSGLQAQSDSIYLTMLIPIQPVIGLLNDTLGSSLAATYQWYVDNTFISGATDQYYVPVVNGNYQVLVTDMNGCMSMSDSLLVTTVGVYENNKAAFGALVYPNPVETRSLLSLNSLVNGSLDVSLLNLTTQEVFQLYHSSHNSSKTLLLTIEAASLTKGLYLLRIINEGEKKTLKMIVN